MGKERYIIVKPASALFLEDRAANEFAKYGKMLLVVNSKLFRHRDKRAGTRSYIHPDRFRQLNISHGSLNLNFISLLRENAEASRIVLIFGRTSA